MDELIRPVVALAGPAHGPGLVGFATASRRSAGTLRIQSPAGRRTGHLVELPLGAPRS
jgi:hypothetical protein